MTDQDFMKLAIEEAKASLAAGGAPIGAIMVKDNEVIAKGWSMVWSEQDPTSHAETNCIKAAYKKLHPNNLTGCTLYATLEPIQKTFLQTHMNCQVIRQKIMEKT